MLNSIDIMAAGHLQLGEGLLLRDVDLDAVQAAEAPEAALEELLEDEGCLIGATLEGCRFQCLPEMIDTVKGKRTPAAGELLQGRWTATLSGVMLEMTPGNAAMLLNTANNGSGVLAPAHAALPAGPERVCWVGSLGEGMAAIELLCPVSTGGFQFQSGRRGTGTMPFTLTAQLPTAQEAGVPWRLLWLKGGAGA